MPRGNRLHLQDIIPVAAAGTEGANLGAGSLHTIDRQPVPQRQHRRLLRQQGDGFALRIHPSVLQRLLQQDRQPAGMIDVHVGDEDRPQFRSTQSEADQRGVGRFPGIHQIGVFPDLQQKAGLVPGGGRIPMTGPQSGYLEHGRGFRRFFLHLHRNGLGRRRSHAQIHFKPQRSAAGW